jgi:hypothetical protein
MPWGGACLYIYSPVEETSSLGLNRLDVGLRLILEVGGGSLWKEGSWAHCARPVGTGWRPVGPLQNLLELRFAPVPSGVFLSPMIYVSLQTSFVLFMQFNHPFFFSGITLQKIWNHQNSWKLSVKTHKFLLVTIFIHLVDGSWWTLTIANRHYP